MKHKRKEKKLKKLKRRKGYSQTSYCIKIKEEEKRKNEAVRARIDRPNIYRLYSYKMGKGTNEVYVGFALINVLKEAEKAMRKDDKNTLYTLIQTGDRITHGDRVLLLFYNQDLPMLGIDIYRNFKELFVSKIKIKNNPTLKRKK